MERPLPSRVKPAPLSLPVPPPEDAIVLFDGHSLDEWRNSEGQSAQWEIRDGALVSVPDSGYLFSARSFGDVQLHVEWAAPVPAQGHGQGRGNSGVFLMGKYEVQVLDSYDNHTYADGQAAAVYGQYPPLINASLPPGEWQSYDIIFRRPRFRRDGALEHPARMTVLHNGILVQDHVELWGPTRWLQHEPYELHADQLPISLQDHGNPVRYRNIWVRELSETSEPGPRPKPPEPVIQLTPHVLQRYTGQYKTAEGDLYTLFVDRGTLRARFYGPRSIELVPHSHTDFSLRWTAARIVFDVADDGQIRGFVFHIGRGARKVSRVSSNGDPSSGTEAL